MIIPESSLLWWAAVVGVWQRHADVKSRLWASFSVLRGLLSPTENALFDRDKFGGTFQRRECRQGRKAGKIAGCGEGSALASFSRSRSGGTNVVFLLVAVLVHLVFGDSSEFLPVVFLLIFPTLLEVYIAVYSTQGGVRGRQSGQTS